MTAEARAGMARVLTLELALLTAEVNLLEELKRAGILPEDARREPTAPELRAGVRFAELDRIVTDTAGLLARKADKVRDAVLDGLAEQLADAYSTADPYEVLARLDALVDPTSGAVLPGLRDVVDEVAAEMAGDLERTAAAAATEALEEGRRQGLPSRLLPDVDPIDDAVRAAATAHGARVAQAPATRLLGVAAEAGQRAATVAGATGATVLEAALDAAEGASRAGTEDLARQAANVTHGLGRQHAQAAMPAPREVYASELLDRNTCGPCATVDGRTYASLDEALVDYPGAGGFVGCDGGSRCRGTLVLVHNTEAAPTLDNPGAGPGSPGGPADRTPRGPASPAPAPATGPLQPDPGVPTPATTPDPVLDDTGRTVMPVEDLDPPVTPVAPDAVDRDPELARYSDEELDRLLVDESAPLAQRMAAADELDQRAAGTRSQVWDEEDYTPEQLAAFEAEREAWEAAGGNYDALAAAVPGATRPAGRAIDRVKSEWNTEVELRYTAAEDATNGYLIRRDRLAEFEQKYGNAVGSVLFEGPARTAYYYASPELRAHWDTLPGGRGSFAEFAEARGIRDAKTTARAKAAREAREDARLRADESAAGQAKRAAQRAEARRRKGPLTAGERLAREQRRRDRIRARERRLNAEANRTDLPETPPSAPPPSFTPAATPPAGTRADVLRAPAPGRPMPMAEWDEAPFSRADQDFRYVADPDDRTAAMLQYDKDLEQLVKGAARNLDNGRPPLEGLDLTARPGHSYDLPDYDLDAFEADVIAAAENLRRLEAANVADLGGTVYKGIQFPPGLSADEIRDALTLDLNRSSFTAGDDVDRVLAYYHGRPQYVTAVVIELEEAAGMFLTSVGNHAINVEALFTGRLDVIDLTQDTEGVWRVRARMAP